MIPQWQMAHISAAPPIFSHSLLLPHPPVCRQMMFVTILEHQGKLFLSHAFLQKHSKSVRSLWRLPISICHNDPGSQEMGAKLQQPPFLRLEFQRKCPQPSPDLCSDWTGNMSIKIPQRGSSMRHTPLPHSTHTPVRPHRAIEQCVDWAMNSRQAVAVS